MPRNKKTDTVVVRPIHRGTGIPRKRVLAPLKALNEHLPLKTLAPALVAPPAKPWKQPKPVPRIYRQLRSTPAHAYTPAMGAEWDEARGAYEIDVEEEWERECARESGYDADQEDRRGRVEVHILDIARPAKPRGPAKEFEVVETVRRVIALEDDDDYGWEEWDIGSEDELEFEEWETVEDEKHRLASYAMVLQQSPG